MQKSITQRLGLIGWTSIEPLLISAFAAQLPIMFVANHGTAKTDGVEILVRALVGNDARYTKYDAPVVQMDDVLGFVDPRAIADGRMEFIRTPSTIWGSDGVMLDELNRTSPVMASKFLELTRKGSIHGQSAGIKYTFAACNPVRQYRTAYMDLASASRWVIVHNPNWTDLSQQEKREVVRSPVDSPVDELAQAEFRALVENTRARVKNLDRAVDNVIDEIVVDIVDRLNRYGTEKDEIKKDKNQPTTQQQQRFRFKVEGRTAVMMARLLRCYHCYRDQIQAVANVQHMLELVLACIPEVHELCESHTDRAIAVQLIQPVLQAAKFHDSLPTITTVDELVAHAATPDHLAWLGMAKQILQQPMTHEERMKVSNTLQGMLLNNSISDDAFNDLFDQLVRSIPTADLDHLNVKDVQLGWQRDGLRNILQSLAA